MAAMRRASRRRRNDRGSAAVEFALVVPILLLLFFGIIQYSIYFWAAQTGTSAVNAAARRLAVGDCQNSGQLSSYVSARLGSANQGGLSVVRAYKDSAGNTVTVPPSLPQTAVGGTVSLTVSFNTLNMHFPIPYLSNTTISKTVEARIEDNSQDTACS